MLFSSTSQNKNVMIGGTGQTRLSVVKSGKSNCSPTKKFITKLSPTASISAGLKGGPLRHQRSFPSSNCIKLNNLVLERVGLQGRGNMYGYSQLPGDPGAKGQGMPVIQAERYERGPVRAVKNHVCWPSSPLWVLPACFKCIYFFS